MEKKSVAISPTVKIIAKEELANSNHFEDVSAGLNSPYLKHSGNQIHTKYTKEKKTLSCPLFYVKNRK